MINKLIENIKKTMSTAHSPAFKRGKLIILNTWGMYETVFMHIDFSYTGSLRTT